MIKSEKIWGALLIAPKKLFQRIKNPYSQLATMAPAEAEKFAETTFSMAKNVYSMTNLIEQMAQQSPEVAEQFTQLKNNNINLADGMLNFYLKKAWKNVSEQKRPLGDITQGIRSISPLAVAEQASKAIQQAVDTGSFIEFILPQETQAIQQLKKKSYLSIEDSLTLVQHELDKAKIIAVGQTISYEMAKSQYEAESQKLENLERGLLQIAEQPDEKNNDKLVELNVKRINQQQVKDLYKHQEEIALGLLTRANFVVNTLTNTKMDLEGKLKQQIINKNLGILQKNNLIPKGDIYGQLEDVRFQNTVEQLEINDTPEDIRAKIQIQRQLKN